MQSFLSAKNFSILRDFITFFFKVVTAGTARTKKIIFLLLITFLSPQIAPIYAVSAHVQNKYKQIQVIKANQKKPLKLHTRIKATLPKTQKKPIIKTSIKPLKLHQKLVKTSIKKATLVYTIQQRLVSFVKNTVNNLRYSAYKLGGTRFDPARGIYVVDCSSYVDRILQTVHPRAFSKLVNYSGSLKPTTHDYYQFFNNLTDEPQHYWDTVDDVSKLRPGDLLVFRYRDELDNIIKGHIVIVMDKPIRNKDTYHVRIADSAPVRHSQDTRMRRVSGIGIGTMLLKVNPQTFRPFAYAWGVNSRWEKNVTFAMARPIEFQS